MPNSEDFRSALYSILSSFRGDNVDVTSGDLHRRVGGYPGRNHAMPVCCSVMRQAMQSGDVIIAEPPKGNGATLTIRYRLPR
ncbi:MAG: HNH endonuclease [Caldiserica bacterium]|nr:HNH endonuclease [Caldisericota bacterium]